MICPVCEHAFEGAPVGDGMVGCPACKVRFHVPGGPSLTLFDRSEAGAARISGHLKLSAEFRARFRIEGLLGVGGMGAVYRARHLTSGREVAIKFLTRLGEPELRARFLREGSVMGRVKAPHVAEILETHVLDEVPYLVCELLAGGSLRERMRGRAMPPEHALAIIGQVLEGLAACHDAGIVHRDLKPENVMFTADGVVRITDLGIARDLWDPSGRLTATGVIIGTPAYMAPEQLHGQTAGFTADVYSAGVLLFELLTGEIPYGSANLADRIVAMDRRELPHIPTASVPPALSVPLLRALDPDPDRRPRTARDFARELREATTPPAAAPPPSRDRARAPAPDAPAAPRPSGMLRTAAPPTAVAALVALGLLGGVGLLVRLAQPRRAAQSSPTAPASPAGDRLAAALFRVPASSVPAAPTLASPAALASPTALASPAPSVPALLQLARPSTSTSAPPPSSLPLAPSTSTFTPTSPDSPPPPRDPSLSSPTSSTSTTASTSSPHLPEDPPPPDEPVSPPGEPPSPAPPSPPSIATRPPEQRRQPSPSPQGPPPQHRAPPPEANPCMTRWERQQRERRQDPTAARTAAVSVAYYNERAAEYGRKFEAAKAGQWKARYQMEAASARIKALIARGQELTALGRAEEAWRLLDIVRQDFDRESSLLDPEHRRSDFMRRTDRELMRVQAEAGEDSGHHQEAAAILERRLQSLQQETVASESERLWAMITVADFNQMHGLDTDRAVQVRQYVIKHWEQFPHETELVKEAREQYACLLYGLGKKDEAETVIKHAEAMLQRKRGGGPEASAGPSPTPPR